MPRSQFFRRQVLVAAFASAALAGCDKPAIETPANPVPRPENMTRAGEGSEGGTVKSAGRKPPPAGKPLGVDNKPSAQMAN